MKENETGNSILKCDTEQEFEKKSEKKYWLKGKYEIDVPKKVSQKWK